MTNTEISNRDPDGRVTSNIARRHPWLRLAERAASWALSLVLVLLLVIVVFRLMNPPITPVILAEKLRGKTIGPSHWVRLEDISRELPLAVLAVEDSGFCNHWGVNWREVWNAIEESAQPGKRRFHHPRGASTIPMQTVKKLYLWDDRSYLRKALEVPAVLMSSALWPKQVVLETYLNILPWGPGIVGAEAASQRYFGKGAGKLTRREAARLAAAVRCPNYRICNPAKPGPKPLSRARKIERDIPYVDSSCLSLRRSW